MALSSPTPHSQHTSLLWFLLLESPCSANSLQTGRVMVVNFFLRISANSAASLPAPAPRYRKAGTFVSRRGEGREECAPDPPLRHAPLFVSRPAVSCPAMSCLPHPGRSKGKARGKQDGGFASIRTTSLWWGESEGSWKHREKQTFLLSLSTNPDPLPFLSSPFKLPPLERKREVNDQGPTPGAEPLTWSFEM